MQWVEAGFPGMLDQKALNITDLNGLSNAGSAALFFAQPSCGAKHAASTAEYVVFFDGTDGTGNIFET